MELLLKEYRESLKAAKKMRESASEEDQKIFAGIIGDLEYAVQWLRDRRMPETRKTRVIQFETDLNAIDMFSFESATLFYVDPFVEVENKIDRERSKSRFDFSR